MKVKVEKVEFIKNRFCYIVYKTKKQRWSKRYENWELVEEFYPSPHLTDKHAKERAIKCADDLLKPKKPIELLKSPEIIYEKSL